MCYHKTTNPDSVILTPERLKQKGVSFQSIATKDIYPPKQRYHERPDEQTASNHRDRTGDAHPPF